MTRSDAELLSWRLDSELEPADARRLDARLEAEPALAQAFAALKRVDEQVRAAFPARAFRKPEVPAQTRPHWWLRVAAMLAIALLAIGVAYAAWRALSETGPAIEQDAPAAPAGALEAPPHPEPPVDAVPAAVEQLPAEPPPIVLPGPVEHAEGAPALRGIVTDYDELPIAGVRVVWATTIRSLPQSMLFEQHAETFTEPDGTFAFTPDDLPDGGSGHALLLFHSDGYDLLMHPHSPIAEGAEVQLHARLARVPLLEGRVETAAGQPVPGAMVAHSAYRGLAWAPQYVTDAQGGFQFRPVHGFFGGVQLHVAAEGLPPRFLRLEHEQIPSTEPAVITLPPQPQVVTVHVNLTRGGRPMRDTALYLFDPAQPGHMAELSPPNYTAALWRPAQDRYDVAVQEPGGRLAFCRRALPVEMDGGRISMHIEWNEQQWDIRADGTEAPAQTHVTRVRLRNVHGQPVHAAHALIDYRSARITSRLHTATGDLDYKLPLGVVNRPDIDLAPTPWAEGTGRVPPLLFFDPESQRVGIPEPGMARDGEAPAVDVVFNRPAYYIDGQVSTAQGRALEDAFLLFHALPSPDDNTIRRYTAQSGPNGTFRVGPFAETDVLVGWTAVQYGYSAQGRDGSTPPAAVRDLARSRLRIVLEPLGQRIAGAVVYLDGVPVSHANVEMARVDGAARVDDPARRNIYFSADAEGAFSRNVPPGRYRMRAASPNQQRSQWVEVDGDTEGLVLYVQAHGDPKSFEPPDDPRVEARRVMVTELGQILLEFYQAFERAPRAPVFNGAPLPAMDWAEFLEEMPELAQWLEDADGLPLFAPGYAFDDEPGALAVLEAIRETPDAIAEGRPLPRADGAGPDYMPFRPGVERFFITDINNPAAGAVARSRIPILWEVPGPQDAGGWVVYADGFASWRPNGGFPHTPDITAGIEALASR